jgi:hypothetical protein
MAVLLDQYATGSASQASLVNGGTFSSTKQTVAVGLFSPALLVGIIDDGTTGASYQVNWDSTGINQLFTQVGTDQVNGVGTVLFFGLANPVAGNKTLAVKKTGGPTSDVDVFSVSLYNADQLLSDWSATVGGGNGTAQTSASLAAPTVAGSYGFSIIQVVSSTPSLSLGGIVRFGPDALAAGNVMGADNSVTGTTVSHIYAFASSNWVGLVFSVPPATLPTGSQLMGGRAM